MADSDARLDWLTRNTKARILVAAVVFGLLLIGGGARAQGQSPPTPTRITAIEPAIDAAIAIPMGRASAPVRLAWQPGGDVANERVYSASSENGPMTFKPVNSNATELGVQLLRGYYEWIVAGTKVPPAGCPASFDDWNDQPGCDLDNYRSDACDGRVLADPPPRPIACTEYRTFTVAATATVASLTAANARRYALQALRNNGWAAAADYAGYHHAACHRVSRLRFRCSISGGIGDGSFHGSGEIWYTTDPADDEFHYRFLVRVYDEYCYAIHHRHRYQLCSKRKTWQ